MALQDSGFFTPEGKEKHESTEHQQDNTPRDVDVMTEGFLINVAVFSEETETSQYQAEEGEKNTNGQAKIEVHGTSGVLDLPEDDVKNHGDEQHHGADNGGTLPHRLILFLDFFG